MIFYIVFFVIFISLCIVNDFFVKKTAYKIGILSLLSIALIIILGIKGRDVGSDTSAYISIYEKALNGDNLGHVSSDYGYAILCRLFAQMNMPYIIFSLFVSFLEVLGVSFLCFTFSRYSGIFFSSFFAISQLQMLFSAQRQSLACSFVFLAVCLLFLLRNKNRFLRLSLFYFFCFLALSFHKASIIAFPIPLFLLIKLNIRHILVLGLSVILLCLFSSQISQLFTRLDLTSYSNIYSNSVQVYSLFGLGMSICIYFLYSSEPVLIDGSLLVSKKSIKANLFRLTYRDYYLKCNVSAVVNPDETIIYSSKFIIFGLIGSIFMSFSSFSGTLTRFAFFCFPLLFISLSNVISFFTKRISLFVYISLVISFLCLFIWLFIYKDPLQCVPYYVEF